MRNLTQQNCNNVAALDPAEKHIVYQFIELEHTFIIIKCSKCSFKYDVAALDHAKNSF